MWSAGHLPVKDLGDEDEVVAARARTTKAETTAEEVAVRAATFGEVACLARRALVDGVGDERLETVEVSGQGLEIGRWEQPGADGRRAACRPWSSSERGPRRGRPGRGSNDDRRG